MYSFTIFDVTWSTERSLRDCCCCFCFYFICLSLCVQVLWSQEAHNRTQFALCICLGSCQAHTCVCLHFKHGLDREKTNERTKWNNTRFVFKYELSTNTLCTLGITRTSIRPVTVRCASGQPLTIRNFSFVLTHFYQSNKMLFFGMDFKIRYFHISWTQTVKIWTVILCHKFFRYFLNQNNTNKKFFLKNVEKFIFTHTNFVQVPIRTGHRGRL